MSNKCKMTLYQGVIAALMLGFILGFVVHNFAVTNASLAAKCKSINGDYGGGKCYSNGVDVTN